jgi:formylglycine-generating enzyme required for sulfatase activity
LDNDCNGRVDDPYPLVGTSCTNGELGACRRTGTYVCNGTGDGVLCNAPPSGGGMPETCNGLDDDCDGRLDEGARTRWVQVRASPALWIMAYEASRPDATSSAPGVLTHTACSEPMRMPWVNVTQSQAASACTAAGGRLCTETEWQLACQAGMGCTWSFASACTTLSTTTCNFNEYDTTPGGGDDDAVLPAGSLPMCYARWAAGNVYDLSGNVAEWTSTSRSSGAGTVFVVRGGSTTTPSGGATCSFDFVVAAPTVTLPNLGFRCCRDTPPP